VVKKLAKWLLLENDMLWVKAFHVIAFVCWFAGLLYLPRLFVYHCQCSDEPSKARFSVMERKLYAYIMTPSAIATLCFGGYLLSYNLHAYLSMGWLHLKLSLVSLLFVYHLLCGHYVRQFANNSNAREERFYRYFNEVPALLLVAIVILAVVKPF
jgi:protoporphyrinogen IX oxidase